MNKLDIANKFYYENSYIIRSAFSKTELKKARSILKKSLTLYKKAAVENNSANEKIAEINTAIKRVSSSINLL